MRAAWYPGLDLVRFSAAMAVALFHLTYWGGQPEASAKAAYPMPGWLGSVTQYGWVGVQVFFVLSGAVIAGSVRNRDPKRFALSRASRLIPAVLVCAPLSALALVACGTPPSEAGMLLAKTLVFWPDSPWVDGVYWTLSIEIAFYAAVWLLLQARLGAHLPEFLAVLGVVSGAYLGLGLSMHPRVAELLLLEHGLFFAIGGLLALKRYRWLLGALVPVSFVQIESAPAFIAWAGATAFIAWSLERSTPCEERKVIRTLGLMTYPLYLLNNVVGIALANWLYAATGASWLAISAAFAAVLFASVWVCRIAEPALKAIKHRSTRRLSTLPAFQR